MRNLSIAARITLGLGSLLAALILAGVIIVVGLGQIDSRVDDVTRHDLLFFQNVSRLQVEVGNLRRFEKDYFLNVADPQKRAGYLAKWTATYSASQQTVDALRQLMAGAGERLGGQSAVVAQQGPLLDAYAAGFRDVSSRVEAGTLTTPADCNAAFSRYKDNVHQMETMLARLSDAAARSVDALGGVIRTTSGEVRTAVLALLALALLGGLLISVVVIRSIRVPLETIRAGSRELATTRDLTLTLPDFGRNELGSVGRSLASLVDTIRSLIQQSHGYSAQLVEAADRLGRMSSAVADASHRQSESAAAGAAAIEQMTVSINVVSTNTRGVAEQARHTTEEADKSSALAARAEQEIRLIAEGIAATSQRVEQLNRRSGEIGDIVKVIGDIADQTNLLALNAAIEAARAGETGRGFAVVADEVRKLAERTSQATGEISRLIGDVQNDTEQANQSMQQANARIDAGVDSARQVAVSLQAIRSLAEQSVGKVSDVADTISEQSQASQDLARSVEQIAQMNDSTNQSIQESHRLAQQLKELSSALDATLNRFRV